MLKLSLFFFSRILSIFGDIYIVHEPKGISGHHEIIDGILQKDTRNHIVLF